VNTYRVLLVDDETDFLDTLSKRLTKRKLYVVCASSGAEALEKLAQEVIDVVVLDVRMPHMNGIETLREIKKLDPSPEVIMLTGHADREVVYGMVSLGVDYLMKPGFDEPHKIQDAIRKAFPQDKE
jgi:DNA-binding NtrC family response regulator